MNPHIEKFKSTCKPELRDFIELIQAESYAEGASDALSLTPAELKIKTEKIKDKLNNLILVKLN